ncbi:GIP [Symbiodinium sp. CCMP2592]|nr:GIP [Symbiodinium sp. CCMP2592]
MRAQTAGPGIEGEDTAPDYAAALPLLPNGVDRPEASPQSMQSLPWSPSVMGSGGEHGTLDPVAEQPPAPPRLPVGSLAGSGLDVRAPSGAQSIELRSPSATAEWPPALRWMGRLNEFLQRATGAYLQTTFNITTTFSGPAAAASYSVYLNGSDRASSTSIPRELVQEEVRRQVMEAMRMQTATIEELRRENELLRARQALEERQSGPRGDQYGTLPAEGPHGDGALSLQQAVPHGDRASLVQQSVPQGDRALVVQQSVSPGDRALGLQQSVPQGDRALAVQPPVPPGDRASLVQQSVPPGDRAYSEQHTRASDDWSQSFSFGGPSGRSLGVQFDLDREDDLPGTQSLSSQTGYPFSGLLQGDVCGASEGPVPPAVSTPVGRLRGDYGSRARSRTMSRERVSPPPPPPGIPYGSASTPVDGDFGYTSGPAPPPPSSSGTASRPKAALASNPLEALVAGMTQIQEVLLRGKSGSDTAEYDPSKSVVEFPKLKENSAESGAIDFQDWLYLVEQQVGSLASGASSWWSGLLAAAMKAYGVYQASTPIQRLTVKAELPPELDDPKYLKLEKRVAALLVAALPQAMRDEMVSYRVQRVHQQLFRLLVCYQPGGSSDRALVLAQLEPKDGPNDVTEVVAALRRWFRWLQRARDLQLSLPDPSVQIKALSSIVRKISEKNHDLQFKIALARTELRTESRPTQETALKFFQHLLAEVEQLGHTKSRSNVNSASATTASSTTTAGDDVQARARAAQVQPKGSSPSAPKDGKGDGCLVCGSKMHKVKDCPRRELEPANDSPSPKGLNKKELKALATVCSGGLATTTATAKSPPPLPPPATAPMSVAAMAAADPPIHPEVSNDSLKEVLAETTKVLKALTSTSSGSFTTGAQPPPAVQDPLQMLARRLQKFTLSSLGEKMALLDSGASHAYRRAADREEQERAQPVSVKLAEGETTLLQTKSGTLLGDASAETLVPLGQLVQILGCTVRWSKNRLIVNHPIHGRLKVQVRDYCPQMAEHEALRLISELEEKRLMEMNNTVKALEMRVAQSEHVMEWFEYVQSYVTTGKRVELLGALTKAPFFKDVSLDTIATAAEDIPLRDVDGWKLLKSMPWSRRKRRSLYRSNDWNVHLFSGPSRPTSTTSTTSRLSVTEASGVNVEVDILDSALMDVTRMDGVFKVLLWGAARGKIRTLIGGPPRRSYLVDDDEKRAKEEPLVIRMLVLAMVAMEGRRQHRSDRLGFALEHPDKVVAQGNVWSSSLWKGFSEVYGMEVVQSGRGSTGTNMYLEALNLLTSTTTTSGVWASEYAQAIGEAVNAWTGFSVHESVLCSVAAGPPPISCKMTAKEWQLHVSRDHIPFRKDCKHCVQSAAGRPHRRVTHKSAYVLSADVAGPFRVKGVNTETNQHRFMLVCAYQFPKLPGTPDAQHESVDDDTGAGAGLEELLFEEEGGDDKHEIIEESGADKHVIIEKDGGAQADDASGPSPEEEAAKAFEPLEFAVAYFVRPLRSRKSTEVLRALQEVYIDVKMLGLPVSRLHSDRAREFRTPAVSAWAASRDILVTRSEGDAPAQNGTAEQAVKYLKSRTRILLASAQDSSGRDIKEVKTWWPMAAETAAVRQRSLVFGLESNPPAGFGTKVFVKRKRYGAEARDLDPKWSSAVYLGPARDVPAGHVVLTDDNHLWNTCNVRQLPDVPMEPDPSTLAARRRISGKKRPPVAPIPLKALRISSLSKGKQEERDNLLVESLPVSEIKSVAKVEYLPKGDVMKPLAQVSHEKQWYALEDCFAILEDTPFKKPSKTRNTEAWGDPGPDVYVTFGAYQHGNFTGVTNATRDYPELVQYLTAFIRRHSGESDPFTSVVVARNLETGLHRDRYNVNGMRNIVISCGAYEQGGLWVEGFHDGLESMSLTLPNGQKVDGSVVPTENQVVKFNPRRLHKSLTWKGTKWTIIAYVNRGFARLPEAKVQELRDCGFLVPRCEEATLSQLRLQEEHVEFDYCETSDEEEHFVQSVAAESSLVNVRKLLDEEEKIESIGPGILDQEERDAIARVNVKAMHLCEALEAAEANRCDDAGDLDSLKWFRLCRLVESGEQHGVEELLRNLNAPLQVVYTLTLGEVRENVTAWKKAILKEVQALINCGALVKLDAAEEDRLQREGKLVILPAKGVFTVKPPDLQAAAEAIQSKPQDQLEFPDGVQSKPQDQLEFPDGVQSKPQDQLEFPDGVQSAKSSHKSGSIPVDALYKRKARLVICGNFEKNISEELYAGGCQTESLRIMVSHASSKPLWDAAVTDIRNAFVLAPMCTDATYGLRFPKVFLLALGPEWDWLYRVDRALYGFRRSPRLWGLFRDARFKKARITLQSLVGNRVAVLRRLVADENIWQVVVLKEGSEEPDFVAAYIVVYVDDILYLGEPSTISDVHAWLSAEWTSSPLTWASDMDGIRFLGLEIYKSKVGYKMCQFGYLRELLRHHDLTNGPGARTPCPREWLIGEGEVEQAVYDEVSLRKAQQMTGELLWLSTKSRPDLMHSVSSMSSLCLRDPILVERIGKRVLAYLFATSQLSLMFFGSSDEPEHSAVAYSDASFSPSGGRSIGCSLITYNGNAVAWRSGRQSLIALSTAESELIEAVAAVHLQAGISSLTSEINASEIHLLLLVDNSAAVGLCTDAPGTWRTRHLRVRAGALRELVREGVLVIRHIPGLLQKADLGTKGFDAVRLFELLELWGLVQNEDDRPRIPSPAAIPQAETTSKTSNHVAGLRVTWVHAVARLAVVLFCLTQPVAGKKSKPDIEVNFAWELYGMVFLLVVAGIAIWEVAKKIWGRLYPEEPESREARRLRKLQSAVRDELQGMGLGSQATWSSSSSSSQGHPVPPPTYATGGEEHPYPPPPPPYPTGSFDDPPHLEELRGTFRRRRGRTTDQAVQTEPRRIQGEVTIQYTTPLYVTKNGKCIHARDTCSSLVAGGRTEQRHLCQLCNRG